MENGRVVETQKKWRRIGGNQKLNKPSDITVRGVLTQIISKLNPNEKRSVIPLGHGDPSAFPCFRTTPVAEDAVSDALRSGKFNGYCGGNGIPSACKAVADYISQDLPYKLSPDDVYLTLGCNQAIELVLKSLAAPNANILLPRPGFPYYEFNCDLYDLEPRHFDLLPESGWEVDLQAVEALADENTVAMVIINPGNPTGSVYTRQHLQKVAETANKLGIMVISDEVYHHLTFGNNPFIPMGVFGSIAPVLTLGSISKRWVVPGWRFGWIAVTDPNAILTQTGFVHCLSGCINNSADPPTFIQGAVPQLLEKTGNEFFSKVVDLLRQDAEICFSKLKEIPCITCPHKPEGSMFVMVKLDVSQLDEIADDMEFCNKLAEEDAMIVMPGVALGLKNWLRITIAIDPETLDEAFERMKAFCQRHAKKG